MIPGTKQQNENHGIHQPHENQSKCLHVLKGHPGNSETLSGKDLAEGLGTPADGS